MKTFKLLSIGNSFSDDAERYLYDILFDYGYTNIIISNLFIGGCTLETHTKNAIEDNKAYVLKVYDKNGYHECENYSIKEALKDDYDYITLQQASYLSGVDNSYLVDKYQFNIPYLCYLDYLIDYVKENSTNKPKFYFHMTWSYDINFKGETFRYYNYSQEEMENGIVRCLKKFVIPNKNHLTIIPNMYVIRSLRQIEGRDVTRDGFHLSLDFGRLSASLSYFSAITSKDPLYLNKPDLFSYNALYNAYLANQNAKRFLKLLLA